MFYNPHKWYWTVGGDDSRIYSSEDGIYIAPEDQSFQEWTSQGGNPTKIDTNDNLGAVLAQHLARPDDSEPDVLAPYLTTLAETMDGRQVLALLDHENRLRFVEKQQGVPTNPPLTTKEYVKLIVGLLR